MSKILIVQQDEDLLLQKVNKYNKQGYQVYGLMDTASLYAKIYSFRPDIIIIAKDCAFIEAELRIFEPLRNISVIQLYEDSQL